MKILEQKSFLNGCVYAMETPDGYPLEVTDTFLPPYTKDAVGSRGNHLRDGDYGSRRDRWMIGVSCMSGCPVGCGFCATGQLRRCRSLTGAEIVEQVRFAVEQNPDYSPNNCYEFKINYTRMGEPFLNLAQVREAIAEINARYPNAHHYISTIGCRGSDFSWIGGNVTLQISLHSLEEERRRALIPFPGLMSLEELGGIRTGSRQKTTLNLTLVDERDFDLPLLERYFSREHFFIKLSPINPNPVSQQNGMGLGVIQSLNY